MADIKVPIKCDCGCGVDVGFRMCPPEEKEKWEKHKSGMLQTSCAIRLKAAAKLQADSDRHFLNAAKEAVIAGEGTLAQKRLVFGKMLENR